MSYISNKSQKFELNIHPSFYSLGGTLSAGGSCKVASKQGVALNLEEI